MGIEKPRKSKLTTWAKRRVPWNAFCTW